IKEEKSYFSSKIQPNYLLSILFVKPKLSNNRLHGQKGAYLLFGLDEADSEKSIPLIVDEGNSLRLNARLRPGQTPIAKITKVSLGREITMDKLEKLGVTAPYIYPEMAKVSEYLVPK